MNGIDYSWARPTGAAIKAAGFDFVMRYVDYPGANGKGLTKVELDDLRAHGLAVGLVFESTANRALEGNAAGYHDAIAASAAIKKLGFPDDQPVYFAVDFDAQPKDMGAIDDYLGDAANELGLLRVGVYGSYAVIDHCHEQGTATWFWQTYAWSGGKQHPDRHIYQYRNGQTLNGGEVDYNEAYGDEQGLWLPEDDVTRTEYEDLVLALFAGSEERALDGSTLPRADRLKNALWRLGERAEGREQSVASLAGSKAASLTVPPHRHDMQIAVAATGGVIKA